MDKQDLCYKSTAIDLLGLTPTLFDKLELEPVKMVPNPNYLSGPKSALFDREHIKSLINSEQVRALITKKRKPKDWAAVFVKKYNAPIDALPDVVAAMFSLNRYTKHGTCSDSNQRSIYALKNSLIAWLYLNGYCVDCRLHVIPSEKVDCFSCDDGVWTSFDYSREERCRKCNGTGKYTKPKLVFVAFRFQVEGEFYSWHQPKKFVKFSYTLSDDDDAMPIILPKPLEISKSKLTECKKLVDWFLGNI